MVVLIGDWCFELSLFCYSNICFFLLCFFASSLHHLFASSLPPSTFVANAGLSGKRLVQEVKSVLADVKLTFAADKQCGKYSGGMKRRLSVANALVGNPQIVSAFCSVGVESFDVGVLGSLFISFCSHKLSRYYLF